MLRAAVAKVVILVKVRGWMDTQTQQSLDNSIGANTTYEHKA